MDPFNPKEETKEEGKKMIEEIIKMLSAVGNVGVPTLFIILAFYAFKMCIEKIPDWIAKVQEMKDREDVKKEERAKIYTASNEKIWMAMADKMEVLFSSIDSLHDKVDALGRK